MSIHKHLPQARKELKKVGWAKGIELAKLARRQAALRFCNLVAEADRQDYARFLSAPDRRSAPRNTITSPAMESATNTARRRLWEPPTPYAGLQSSLLTHIVCSEA